MLRNPRLRDFPMAVSGSSEDRHGIILAANYPAKKYGIKTAMTNWQARRLCPDLIPVRPRMNDYIQFSGFMRQIYMEYSDRVQGFGLDEAWLDLTGCVSDFRQAEVLIDEIRERIYRELGLTVSIGLSWNKIFAKLGSDLKKPNACTSIPFERYKQIVWPLPVEELLYVGPATKKKFNNRAIFTIGDLANTKPEYLKNMLGKVGLVLHAYANGEDKTPVSNTEYVPPIKSIGNSSTAPRDLETDQDVKIMLYALSESVGARLMEQKLYAQVVEFSYVGTNLSFHATRQMKLARPTNISGEIAEAAFELFKRHHGHWPAPLRKIGVRGSSLIPISSPRQLDLFVDELRRANMEELEAAIFSIRNRFGNKAVQRCTMLMDRGLSKLDARKNHTVYPAGVFREGMGKVFGR
jgi:DNA polymerase-4